MNKIFRNLTVAMCLLGIQACNQNKQVSDPVRPKSENVKGSSNENDLSKVARRLLNVRKTLIGKPATPSLEMDTKDVLKAIEFTKVAFTDEANSRVFEIHSKTYSRGLYSTNASTEESKLRIDFSQKFDTKVVNNSRGYPTIVLYSYSVRSGDFMKTFDEHVNVYDENMAKDIVSIIDDIRIATKKESEELVAVSNEEVSIDDFEHLKSFMELKANASK